LIENSYIVFTGVAKNCNWEGP